MWLEGLYIQSNITEHIEAFGRCTSALMRLYLEYCVHIWASLHDRYGGPGAYPEKGSEVCEVSGTQVSCGAAERTGIVQPGEEEAQGRPYSSLK